MIWKSLPQALRSFPSDLRMPDEDSSPPPPLQTYLRLNCVYTVEYCKFFLGKQDSAAWSWSLWSLHLPRCVYCATDGRRRRRSFMEAGDDSIPNTWRHCIASDSGDKFAANATSRKTRSLCKKTLIMMQHHTLLDIAYKWWNILKYIILLAMTRRTECFSQDH